MYTEVTSDSFSFHLRNIASLRFTEERHYTDIISPFSRIYLITSGSGSLLIGDEKIILEAGNLYFIPSFTPCTYHFEEGLCQYYVHFSIDNASGMDPVSMYSFAYKRVANDLDKRLFQRMLQINPDLQLIHHHPRVYQTKILLNQKVSYSSVSHFLETVGMLRQLFSRFPDTDQKQAASGIYKNNIRQIIGFIHENLNNEICVNELAEMACFSKDHFSRVFKAATGMSPCDYIIEKRIEKARYLLLNTDMAQKEIIEQTGFRSTSYFSRIFKTHTTYSPASYRQRRG